MAAASPSLQGKVVAVTGAARGIGRATAHAVAQAGARVALGDLDADLAHDAAAEIGPGAIGLELDVTDRERFARFLAETEAALGPLDALVNNAGIMPLGPFLEEDDELVERQFQVNVQGVMNGMRLALPSMRERGRGHVVNIASILGKVGLPGAATYVATKHAVVGLSQVVRAELRGSGVELSVVFPGLVRTEMTEGTSATRPGFDKVEPSQVAQAIVGVLVRPRAEVYVPATFGWAYRLLSPFPPAVRDVSVRLLRGDRALTQLDGARRAAYEARAAGSAAPGR